MGNLKSSSGEGDPLKDITLLAASGKNLRLIMRAGEVIKDELH